MSEQEVTKLGVPEIEGITGVLIYRMLKYL